MFVQNTIMYVVIMGFYGAEFKFTGPNTWHVIVYPFWDVFRVPWGLLALKIPKKSFSYQKDLFGAYILIDLLNFSKI